MGLHEIKQAIVDKIEQYGQEREEKKKQQLADSIDELHDLMESEATAQGTYDVDEEIGAIRGAIKEIKSEKLSRKIEPVKKEVKRELGLLGGALKKGYQFAFPPRRERRDVSEEGVPGEQPERPRRESLMDKLHARAEANRGQRGTQPRKLSSLEILKERAGRPRSNVERHKSSWDMIKEKAERNRASRKARK